MKCKLSDICEFVGDSTSCENVHIYSYISTENMIQNKGGIEPAKSTPAKGAVREYLEKDVLISNIRPYFKKIWQADRVGTCSNDVLVLRAKKNCCPHFLYCILSNDSFFEYMTCTSKGTKMPRGDKDAVMNYLINLPCLDAQTKIGKIIESIDRLISLNKEINDYLADSARLMLRNLLNKESSNKKIVLSNIANITMGQSPPGNSYNETGEGTMFYQGRAEFGEYFPKPRLYTIQPKRMAFAGDVLMSVRAPVGDINLALTDCCIGRGLAAIRSKNGKQAFMHYLLELNREQLDLYNREGTVFGCIGKDQLNDMEAVVPINSDIELFERYASSVDHIIRTNYIQNINLISIRDVLLPRLMSGDVKLSDMSL